MSSLHISTTLLSGKGRLRSDGDSARRGGERAQRSASSKEGVALKNEMSNYTNSLRSIRDVLLDNENYTSCPLYKRLKADIQHYIDSAIAEAQSGR